MIASRSALGTAESARIRAVGSACDGLEAVADAGAAPFANGCPTQPQDEKQGGESEQDGTPHPCLQLHSEERLEQERICEQGTGGAGVRGRVEEVGIGGRGAGPRPRQPGLNERRQGRSGDEGEAERARERPEQPQGGWKSGRCFAKQSKPSDWSRQRDADPQRREDGELRHRRGPADKEMRKCVAREQCRLEENHRGIPHRRRAAEHGQDSAYCERLDPEHEPRAGEDDEAIEPQWRGSAKQARGRRNGICVMTHRGTALLVGSGPCGLIRCSNRYSAPNRTDRVRISRSEPPRRSGNGVE